jgi:hypothetical protein
MPLPDPPSPPASPEQAFAHLRKAVIEELREGTGNPALDLDDSDSVDLQLGDVQLVVWVRNEPLSVRVWCGLAKPVDLTPEVGAFLNDANNELTFARVYSYRDAIFLTVDVQAEPFSTAHLRQAVIGIASLTPQLRAHLAAVTSRLVHG